MCIQIVVWPTPLVAAAAVLWVSASKAGEATAACSLIINGRKFLIEIAAF
jgi:hypothetical protein